MQINPYGLYTNIVSRNNIEGLRSSDSDSQSYGYWLPHYMNGELYLVDTYHINSPSLTQEDTKGTTNRTDSFIKQRVNAIESQKDDSWVVRNSNTNYAYGGSVKATLEMMKNFKEVCDLREMKFVDNSRDYAEKDKCEHVKLWFEHSWPYGVSLIKKDAKEQLDIKFENELHEVLRDIPRSIKISNYLFYNNLHRLEKLESGINDHNKDKLNFIREYAERLNALNEEYEALRNSFIKNLNDCRDYHEGEEMLTFDIEVSNNWVLESKDYDGTKHYVGINKAEGLRADFAYVDNYCTLERDDREYEFTR